ncbi:hypothetical protein ACFU6K_27610 [Kitasatospora sp. NPDC057512]|uniref:hypothetical protein n=1 Tax=Kitasatospora sp. NPDC057512 TaxID=3346154 RepID=UPI0036C33530
MTGGTAAGLVWITAALDQVHAARDDLLRLLDGSGARGLKTIHVDDSPPWARTTREALVHARDTGALRQCGHLSGVQPCVVLAEATAMLLCWGCYLAAQATRVCHDCGAPAGSKSLFGGVEDRIGSVATMHSRVRCPPCARRIDPARPGGTFGAAG